MKFHRYVRTVIQLEAGGERFQMHTKSGHFFIADKIEWTDEGLPKSVTLSGRALKADGELGVIDRRDYFRLDELPGEVQEAIREYVADPAVWVQTFTPERPAPTRESEIKWLRARLENIEKTSIAAANRGDTSRATALYHSWTVTHERIVGLEAEQAVADGYAAKMEDRS